MLDYTLAELFAVLANLPRRKAIRLAVVLAVVLLVLLLSWSAYREHLQFLRAHRRTTTSSLRNRIFGTARGRARGEHRGGAHQQSPLEAQDADGKFFAPKSQQDDLDDQEAERRAVEAFKAANLKRQRGG